MVIACIRERSLLFMVNVISIVGLTIIMRYYVSSLYESFISLKTLNLPLEAIVFLLVGVHGRNKEK